MFSAWARIFVASALIVVPPLLGAWVAGLPVRDYLQFPPPARPADHPGFSTPVFLAILAGVAAIVGPFIFRLLRCLRGPGPGRHPTVQRAFPWWGWLGLALVAASWIVAWSRLPQAHAIQRHTFIPLWIGFVLAINGVAQWHVGSCLLASLPRLMLALFPMSAGFWWLFEYLNGFVANWRYPNSDDLESGHYAIFATLSFSTVLPAVMSTTWYFAKVPAIRRACEGLPAVCFARPKAVAVIALAAGSVALAGLAVWPQYLFPLVWIAPGLSIVSVQWLFGAETGFEPLVQGDWSPLWAPALASLACGFLWEMWNSASLARWEYAIPYVDRFHLFEMPALGYAGYLPFGVACLAASALLVGPLGGRASVRSIVDGADGSGGCRH